MLSLWVEQQTLNLNCKPSKVSLEALPLNAKSLSSRQSFNPKSRAAPSLELQASILKRTFRMSLATSNLVQHGIAYFVSFFKNCFLFSSFFLLRFLSDFFSFLPFFFLFLLMIVVFLVFPIVSSCFSLFSFSFFFSQNSLYIFHVPFISMSQST